MKEDNHGCFYLFKLKHSIEDWLAISRECLESSITVNGSEEHIFSSRVNKSNSNRYEHRLLNWLARSGWYFLAEKIEKSDGLEMYYSHELLQYRKKHYQGM